MLKALTKSKSIDELSGLQLFQLVRYGSLLIISIVLAKSGMDLESFGRYELLIFFTGAISFFWLTGIIQSLLPLYRSSRSIENIQNPNGRSAEIFNAFFLLFGFSILGALLVILVGMIAPEVVEENFHPDLIAYLAAFIIFQTPSSLTEYIYTLRKEGKKVVAYGVLAFGFQILAVAIPALLGLELKWVLTGLVGSAFLRFVWLLILLSKVSLPRFSVSFMREHLHLGLPIMLSVLLSGSATYIDGFIITGYFNEDVFAVFRNGARELPLVALLAHALSSAMVPEFRDLSLPDALEKLKSRSLPLINIMFPLSLLLLILSYYLFPLIYDERFFDSAGVFNLYLLLVITRLVFPQTILIGLKRTRILVFASGLEWIINISLSLILVQIWGIRGVALATVIAYIFERLFLVIWIRSKMQINPSQYIHVGKQLIWSIVLIVVYILVELFIGGGLTSISG